MQDTPDLDALRSEWDRVQDGATGFVYAEALEQSGRLDEAAAVFEKIWDAGVIIGYYGLAWLERGRDNIDKACELMAQALELCGEDDHEDGDLAAGILGMWQWHFHGRLDAEPLLRRGAHIYEEARAALGQLLRATDRESEAESVLRVGVNFREVNCFILLGNLLSESGRAEEAEAIYAQGFELGDAFSAFNLSLMLREQERYEEADHWMWLAAKGGDEMAISFLAEQGPDLDAG